MKRTASKKISRRFWGLLFAVLIPIPVIGYEVIDARSIQIEFDRENVEGTFVLFDLSRDVYIIFNPERARKRYIPASTFKIANTLIGLESGVVNSVDDVLPYGGAPQPQRSWEKDMGLRDAIRVSNVPIYQELARRIGAERMQTYIDTLSYGNRDSGVLVDRFWLDGPLRISAVEQVEFLRKLLRSTLPIAKHSQKVVREILLLDGSENCQLYGKTGWGSATEPGIGWWVGWISKGQHTFIFAMNLDIHSNSDGVKRIRLGKKILSKAGLWPC